MTRAQVSTVLRRTIGMRYRRVKATPWHGNSQKSLCLRQLYARTLIDRMAAGDVICNVDQTWLPVLDFRRMRWRERGATNSLALRLTRPRVSVIAAIFSTGEVYYCVSLSNTNADTLLLWLTKLTQRLDRDRPGWASTVLFTLDGGKYHRTAPVREQMARLGMQVAISGPYQYDAAPIELYFA